MSDLDQNISIALKPEVRIPYLDGAFFISGLKKMAEGELPDTTGAVEGPFLVPLPQAVELIAQMISNEFKTQVYYVYYANMLRGLSHEGVAEEFMEHAENELEHANYLLRRMGVLSPGGVSIPPYPPPEPLSDPNEIVKAMIVVEQMGLSLWKQLHSIMGENPMKYTVEQFLQREEEHQDELWQLVEPGVIPETPTAETMAPAAEEPKETAPSTKVQVETGPKTASIVTAALRRKVAAAVGMGAKDIDEGAPEDINKKKAAIATYDQLRRAGMDKGYTGKDKKAADLTASSRAEIKDSNFVFPETRKYPIHDRDHALAALGMVAMHGSDDEKSKVRSAVESRYPGLGADRAKKAAYYQDRVHEINKDVDAIHHKDQVRVEVTPVSPAALRSEKPDVQKKHDNTKSPSDVAVKPVGAPVSLVDIVEKATKMSAYVGGAVLPDGSGFFKGTVGKDKEKKSDLMVPSPGADSPEDYVQREKELAADQAMAEASHAKTVAMQASQAASQAQAQAEAAQQALQQSQAQVEQLTQQAQQESAEAMTATQQAAEAEARAADHSIAKMQLGMRVNQLRQELANLVMQDPVAESAGSVSDLAAQGMPATPQQQAEAEMMAQQGVVPGQPGADAQGQQAQPQGQEQPAAEGGEQPPAEGGEKKDGKPGTHVTVKTSETLGTIIRKPSARGAVGAVAAPAAQGLGALVQKARPFLPAAGAAAGLAALGGGAYLAHKMQEPKTAGVIDSAGRAAGRGLAEGAGEAVVEGAKKHAPKAALGALIGGGLLAAHGAHERSKRKSDMTDAVTEGIRRSKTASPADRRLAQAVLESGRTVSRGDVLDAAVHQAIDKGVSSARKGVSELGPKLRPHAPAFVAGLGAGILGTKALSSKPNDQTATYYGQ